MSTYKQKNFAGRFDKLNVMNVCAVMCVCVCACVCVCVCMFGPNSCRFSISDLHMLHILCFKRIWFGRASIFDVSKYSDRYLLKTEKKVLRTNVPLSLCQISCKHAHKQGQSVCRSSSSISVFFLLVARRPLQDCPSLRPYVCTHVSMYDMKVSSLLVPIAPQSSLFSIDNMTFLVAAQKLVIIKLETFVQL